MHVALVALVLASIGLPCLAQSAPSDYDSNPAADPARPTVTNPAHIPPPGYLQFEQGVDRALDSPGVASQFSIVQTTKVALRHHLMVQAATQPFAHSRLPSSSTSNDTGDIVLGVQALFTDREEGHSAVPTVALAYNGRVRSGTSPDLDVGGNAQGLTLLASGTLRGFHYDTNAVFNQQGSTNGSGLPVRRAQFGQTISLSQQVTSRLTVAAEFWRFTQPFIHGKAAGVLFSPAFALRRTLVLDAGFEHGLTSSSATWQAFAGFTYLLPHRLWPRSRP